MAEKILSQDEVEALLQGVTGGDVETDQNAEVDPGAAHSYDLANQERIIRGRMPSLEIINERFSRFFQVTVSSFLKREIDMVSASIEAPKFGEFMRKIPLPSSINILKMKPLRGFVLLVIDAKFIYRLVDLYFGGSGQTYVKIEGRDFTTIEARIIQNLLELMMSDLQRSWKSIYPVEISHVRSEINPQFAAVVAPSEVIVSTAFKAEIDGEGGDIFIGLPYPTIEPIREKLHGGFQSDQLDENSKWAERFAEQLNECGMTATAEVGQASLTIGEVSDLSVGDVIILNKSASEDLELKIEGRTIFNAQPGVSMGNVAVQITSIAKGRKEEDGE